MENNELQNNDQTIVNDAEENKIVKTDEAPDSNTLPSDLGSDVSEENTGNLDICPNCLEPNTDNLAVCKYCGMPLHQGADPEAFERKETEEELAKNRAEAVPPENKPKKKQESGFRRVMPWLGLYLIYYAITGFFDVKRQIQQALEEGQPVNETLAYLSQVIWLAAGLMMAWPLIKKGYRKLRHLPDEDEETEEETTAETVDNAAADENTEPVTADAETPEGEPETQSAETDNAEQAADLEEQPEENPVVEAKLSNEDGTEEDERANWL